MADYSKLKAVLDAAYDQSANGKGKARHANGKDFDRQPILEIGRMVGPGYATGQLMKKAQEAVGMVARCDHAAAVQELLGTIVYAAAAVVLIEEHHAEFDRNVALAAQEVADARERGEAADASAARTFTTAAERLRAAAGGISLGRADALTKREEVRGHDGLTHEERMAGLVGGLSEAISGTKRPPAPGPTLPAGEIN